MGSAQELAAELIAAHAKPHPVDEQHSILNYAEAPRIGDWTLRSALVRLAQPHPLRSEAVLQLVRRLDAAVKPLTRSLQTHGVKSSRSIPGGERNIADVRIVDLAADPDVLAAYHDLSPLDDDELAGVQLVHLALQLDRLADTLTAWASQGPEDPPVDEIDRSCASVLRQMHDYGVPAEPQWVGPRGGSRGV